MRRKKEMEVHVINMEGRVGEKEGSTRSMRIK